MRCPQAEVYNSLLSSINKNSTQLSRHDQIRLKHWLQKLSFPITNSVWRQNRDLYLRVLNEMVLDGQLTKPFNQSPHEGPLPKLTIFDVPYPIRVRLGEDNGKAERRSHSKSKSKHSHNQSRKNSTADQVQCKVSVSKGKQMEHKKRIAFDQKQSEFDDKENTLNYLKLFKSNKESKESSISENKTQKVCFESHSQTHDENRLQGIALLKKIAAFLDDNSHSFSSDRSYGQLMKKIRKNGKKIGIEFKDMRNQNEQGSRIEKCSQRIKNKLLLTDLNSLEFMSYLNSLA